MRSFNVASHIVHGLLDVQVGGDMSSKAASADEDDKHCEFLSRRNALSDEGTY